MGPTLERARLPLSPTLGRPNTIADEVGTLIRNRSWQSRFGFGLLMDHGQSGGYRFVCRISTDKRAWSRAFSRPYDPGIVVLCRLPTTNRTLMLSPISAYDNRSARPSDSDSHGWLRLDHPGNAGHPLIRLQPVCMLICIGHNDHFVGASITCQLLEESVGNRQAHAAGFPGGGMEQRRIARGRSQSCCAGGLSSPGMPSSMGAGTAFSLLPYVIWNALPERNSLSKL